MIVTCDSCNTRYLVADTLLGDDGRRVRCTVCQHEWYQDLVVEETIEKEENLNFQDLVDEASAADEETADDEISFKNQDNDDDDLKLAEDIPEAVVPLPDEYSPALIDQDSLPFSTKVVTYLCSLFVGGIVLLILILFKAPLVSSWLPMVGFYQMIGVEVELQGDGLQLSEVRAITGPNKEGINILYIEGNIINFKNQDVSIPKLRASLVNSDGDVVDSWIVPLPVSVVSQLGSLSFK